MEQNRCNLWLHLGLRTRTWVVGIGRFLVTPAHFAQIATTCAKRRDKEMCYG
jgi:hypothetical protein